MPMPMVQGGGNKRRPTDWKTKWGCNGKTYDKCWASHRDLGCEKAESNAECTTRLTKENDETKAVQEKEGYDKVVTRFTDLQSVPHNLAKIAEYLRTKLDETANSQLLSNNFCTFGSLVHSHVNVQFEIVKMLVRALDLQDLNTSDRAGNVNNYKNTVLDDLLKNPKHAFEDWNKLMASTKATHEQPSEIAAVNALLISCGVILEKEVVTQMLASLHTKQQKIVNSQLQTMQGNADFAHAQNDPTYLKAAQLASDVWVTCNDRTSNLTQVLERVVALSPQPAVVVATHKPEETEIQPMRVAPLRRPLIEPEDSGIQPMRVAPLRSPSVADQRMMYQIFGNMRANRLRHSPRQRRSSKHGSKHSSRPRQRQTRGLSQSRRPWRHRSPAMSKARPRSLSRTNQRPRLSRPRLSRPRFSRPRLSRPRLNQRRGSNTKRRKSNTKY